MTDAHLSKIYLIREKRRRPLHIEIAEALGWGPPRQWSPEQRSYIEQAVNEDFKAVTAFAIKLLEQL